MTVKNTDDPRDEAVSVTESQVIEFLEHWSLAEARISLVAYRENTVYRIDTTEGKTYALRVRRVGYRSDNEIISELDWTAMLAKEGLHVPLPIKASDGSRMVRVGQHRADLVTWLSGLHGFTSYRIDGQGLQDSNAQYGIRMRYWEKHLCGVNSGTVPSSMQSIQCCSLNFAKLPMKH